MKIKPTKIWTDKFSQLLFVLRYMESSNVYAVALLIVIAGCSLEVGNPQKPKPRGEELSQHAVDAELIAEQSDAGLTAAHDTVDSSASLALLDASFDFDSLAPECTIPSEGSVSWNISISKQWEIPINRRTFSVVMKHTRTLERTKIFSAAGVSCVNNRPHIPWANVSSVTINTSMTRAHNFTATVPADLRSRQPTQRDGTTKITQAATLTRVSSVNATSVWQKSTTYEGTHSLSLTHSDGAVRTVSATTKTVAPIVMNFTVSSGIVTSRTLVSGTTESTDTSSGGVIRQEFANLSYNDAISCTPNEGTISGTLIESDGTTVRDRFTITFSAGQGVLTFSSNGEQESYQAECQ